MHAFEITGGRPLRGEVTIQGAKNAALPLMAAGLLASGDAEVAFHNVPNLSDIRSMLRLLTELGMPLERDAEGTLRAEASTSEKVQAPYEIVKTMRAGICVLGPLLARRGRAEVSMPGGCAIGTRPVDLHLRGLEALGATIRLDAGYIVAEAPLTGSGGARRLRGAHVFLGGPNGSTVLGTANVMSAATLARGTTVIECAACEPEIEDLGAMLIAMGARIEGLGSPRVTVHGVEELSGVEHAVMPDRIEAGTYLAAAAATGGDVTLHRFPVQALGAFLAALRDMGIALEPAGDEPADRDLNNAKTATVRGVVPRRLDPTAVVTQPHPGFPTDLQAQLMALLCLADGNSLVTEKIFPDRFLHVPELQRMGADITRLGPSAMVRGVRELIGAPVMASDLRASAGLVIAGLAARGTTLVQRVYHLDRGYEAMETRLQGLGAEIRRVDL